MNDGVLLLIILVLIAAAFIFCVFALKRKKLWPKIVVLGFAMALLSVAGLFGVFIANISASYVDAKVASVQRINDYDYKVECEYTYKNKIYRAFVEKNFNEEPEAGSAITVRIKTGKPDEINIYRGDESGDGLMVFFLIFGILIIGGIGVIILIPSIISIVRFCKNKRISQKR